MAIRIHEVSSKKRLRTLRGVLNGRCDPMPPPSFPTAVVRADSSAGVRVWRRFHPAERSSICDLAPSGQIDPWCVWPVRSNSRCRVEAVQSARYFVPVLPILLHWKGLTVGTVLIVIWVRSVLYISCTASISSWRHVRTYWCCRWSPCMCVRLFLIYLTRKYVSTNNTSRRWGEGWLAANNAPPVHQAREEGVQGREHSRTFRTA